MLDTSKLKVGSVVRLEVTVTKADGAHLAVSPPNRNDFLWVPRYFFERAELISTPEPTFTREQIEAIKKALKDPEHVYVYGGSFDSWLDEHEDNSSNPSN